MTLARAVLMHRLMGASAGPSARVDGADHPRPAAPRPAAPRPAAPRPAAPAHTVREILPPWHLIEAQAAQAAQAAQEAENAQWLTDDAVEETEPPPSSGVRMSDPCLGVATPIPDSPLTFKVYTLAELESRDAPSSLRLSQAGLDSAPARRHGHAVRWQSVYAALRAFAVATVAWWQTKETEGFRPSARIALRAPFDALGDALQVAVEAVDWKKHGVTIGIVIGATFTLLFGVLTAAELTDDLKPGTAPHLATTEIAVPLAAAARPVAPASNMAAMGMQRVPPPVVTIAAPEPDEADPDPAPAKPAAKKPKAKSNKLTFPNADAVFNP